MISRGAFMYYSPNLLITEYTMTPIELQKKLETAIKATPLAETVHFRPMFGGILGYVKDVGFVSLSDVGLAFKLAPADQDELLLIDGAKRLQYDRTQPISKQYVVVAESILADDTALAAWAVRSAEYTLTLPKKKKN